MCSVSLLRTAGSLRPRGIKTASSASKATLPLSGPCYPRAATRQWSPRFGNSVRLPSPGIGGPQVSKQSRTVKVGAGFPSAEELQGIASLALDPHPGLLAGTACNSLVYLLGIKVLLKGLTPAGVAHSWVLGTTVYAAFGAGGYALVCLYFILGSAVTKLKLSQKQAEGIAEARGGRRGPASVWGSGIAGLLCAVAALTASSTDAALWQVGFVASFASKLSDTVSSEVGKAYGRTTYLSTSFKVVPRGTEGAVSLEGTLAGVAAAVVFSGLSLGLNQVDVEGAVLVCTAAIVANYFESCLGATVQGDVPWLTNDVVNMLQISVAAATALALRAATA